MYLRYATVCIWEMSMKQNEKENEKKPDFTESLMLQSFSAVTVVWWMYSGSAKTDACWAQLD